MKVGRSFTHRVQFIEGTGKAIIERVFADGTAHLFTEVDFSRNEGETTEETLKRCSSRLGGDIALDSPVARRILGLE